MNWIKQADKLGKYKATHKGFRIYTVVSETYGDARHKTNGSHYKTVLAQGEYVAIDQSGFTLSGDYWNVIADINAEVLRREVCQTQNI